jgi:hypothetical protein
MSKKTLKALKKNRKKYNEGGIPTPVAPTPVAPTGVPEENQSLLQPQIQQTPESAAGAAQKTMTQQSATSQFYQPPETPTMRPTTGIPEQASDEENEAARQRAEQEQADSLRLDDARFQNYINAPLSEDMEKQQVEDQIKYFLLNDMMERAVEIEDNLENFPDLYNRFHEFGEYSPTYVAPEPEVTAAPEWTGASVDDITQAARTAELGGETSESDLAQFDYNGDGAITYQDAFDYANGETPGLLEGTAQPVIEEAEPVAPAQPVGYDGSTGMPDRPTVTDFEKRIEYLNEGPGGSTASNAFKNSIKESNPTLYYATFPDEKEQLDAIESYDGASQIETLLRETGATEPTVEQLLARKNFLDNFDQTGQGTYYFNQLKDKFPDVFNEAFPPSIEETYGYEGAPYPEDEDFNNTGELIDARRVWDAANPEVVQEEEDYGYDGASDLLRFAADNGIEVNATLIKKRAEFLESMAGSETNARYHATMREKFPVIYGQAFPTDPLEEVEEIVEEQEEELGKRKFTKDSDAPSAGDYMLEGAVFAQEEYQADLFSWEVAKGVSPPYMPKKYVQGSESPRPNEYRGRPNEELEADMASWRAAQGMSPKMYHWELGDDVPQVGDYETVLDFQIAKYHYQKAGNVLVAPPKGPYHSVPNPNNVDFQAQAELINKSGSGIINIDQVFNNVTEDMYNPNVTKSPMQFDADSPVPIPAQYKNESAYRSAMEIYNRAILAEIPKDVIKRTTDNVTKGPEGFHYAYAKQNFFENYPDMLVGGLLPDDNFKVGDAEPNIFDYLKGTPERYERAWNNWNEVQNAVSPEEAARIAAEEAKKEQERLDAIEAERLAKIAEEEAEAARLAEIEANKYRFEPEVNLAPLSLGLVDNKIVIPPLGTGDMDALTNPVNYNAELEVQGPFYEWDENSEPPTPDQYKSPNYYFVAVLMYNHHQEAKRIFGEDVVFANSLNELATDENGEMTSVGLGTAANPLPPLLSFSNVLPELSQHELETRNPAIAVGSFSPLQFKAAIENYEQGAPQRAEERRAAEEAAEAARKAEEEAEAARKEQERLDALAREEAERAARQAAEEAAEAARVAEEEAEAARKEQERLDALAAEAARVKAAEEEAARVAAEQAALAEREAAEAAETARLAEIEAQRIADEQAAKEAEEAAEAARQAAQAAADAAAEKQRQDEAAELAAEEERQRIAALQEAERKAAEEEALAQAAAEEAQRAQEAEEERKRLQAIEDARIAKELQEAEEAAAEEQRRKEEEEAAAAEEAIAKQIEEDGAFSLMAVPGEEQDPRNFDPFNQNANITPNGVVVSFESKDSNANSLQRLFPAGYAAFMDANPSDLSNTMYGHYVRANALHQKIQLNKSAVNDAYDVLQDAYSGKITQVPDVGPKPTIPETDNQGNPVVITYPYDVNEFTYLALLNVENEAWAIRNSLYQEATRYINEQKAAQEESEAPEFVMPEFDADSLEPDLSQFPVDKHVEIYAAWQDATRKEEPEESQFDALGRPKLNFYTYEGSEGQMVSLEDYTPDANTAMPTADLFANSPIEYLNNFSAYMAKWKNRPQPETSDSEETSAPVQWEVASYDKGSNPPSTMEFRGPEFPVSAFSQSINAWVSAQDIKVGDDKPVQGTLTDAQFAPLLDSWYAVGNTDEVVSPPTPISDDDTSDNILDQQQGEETDTSGDDVALPEQPSGDADEQVDDGDDDTQAVEIKEMDALIPMASPLNDYSDIIQEPIYNYYDEDGLNAAENYNVRVQHNLAIEEYNRNVLKLDEIYDAYDPIISGEVVAEPIPPKRKVRPSIPDGGFQSAADLQLYKYQLNAYNIYKIADEKYDLAFEKYRSSQGESMATTTGGGTETRTTGIAIKNPAAGAPTNITQTVPTPPTITQQTDLIDSEIGSGTTTLAGSIQKLDDAGQASTVGVSAGNLGDTAQQAAPTDVSGPETDVTGAEYTAETVGADVITGTAATDTTAITEATATAPTATGATAATVDQADITAAKATAAQGTVSEDSIAIAASSYRKAKQTPEYLELEAAATAAKEAMEADPLYKASKMVIPLAIENGASEGHIKGLYDSLNRVPSYLEYAQLEQARLKYLDSAGAQRIAEVEGPDVATAYSATTLNTDDLAQLISIAEDRGVDIEDLPEFDETKKRTAQSAEADTGIAAQIDSAATATADQAAVGTATGVSALTTDIEDIPAYAKAATRTAQTADAATGEATTISDADVATDLEGREAITGTAPQGSAAEIGGVPTYESAQMTATTSEDRTLNASEMLEVVADMPETTAAAIAQDPAVVEAQLDTDPDPEVSAKIAALPPEALVSAQMEVLLAGIDDGNIPAWARPTVDALEGVMARRGLSASTVGRDALFNAIIQSALPIAQGNATALQNRANLNLTNEQNAEIAQANNVMQVRLGNLANRQLAASETARMAQEIAVKQSTFDQQAAVISSEQQQQTALVNTQNAQAKASADAQMQQQAALAEFSENSRRDYENLKALNDASVNNLNAEQSMRLKKYDAELATIIRQAELDQDIEKANLNASLSVELQNLTQQNDAAKDTMTVENQERLVNLQTLVDLRKTNATLAQQMDMANLTNEQQVELAVLQDKAATDAANFTADNQFRLTELNNKVARNIRQAELDQRIAEINLDASLKLELTELTELNATNRANMTAENQVRLANLNALIDFKKTNATFTQQMEMANLSNEQQITIANLTEKAAADAANFTEANRFELQKLTTAAQLLSTNEQLRLNADMARLSTEERVALANLTYTNQFDSAKMTAENTAELQRYEKQIAVAQSNAQLAQQMGLAELSNSQQAAMFNAQVNANLDMKQFDFDQQVALANSGFMQTMTIKEFDAEQQVAIQNATMFANMSMAGADQATKLAITNAQNFLQMDLSNLANKQQVAVLNAQMAQQAMISDVAAENAAAQFNAANQQQADQYMASLGVQIEQYNVSAMAARNQFNATERNRQAAINAGNFQQADALTAQLQADLDKFNEQQDLARDQWNAANAQAVEQSNIQWRRQANTANTAATNAANQQNAQIAFNLTSQEQTQLWQVLRDEAAYARQAFENKEQRNAQLYATAISNEQLVKKQSTLTDILNIEI